MLYKSATTKQKLMPSNMKMEWFSIVKNYDEDNTYGKHKASYKTKRPLVLYDLGSLKARERLKKLVEENGLEVDLDPNYQYSGSAANLKVHKILKKVLKPQGFDGTYIHRSNAPATHPLAGPSEVVLWGNIPKLIKLVKITESSSA
jgi:hypothetical protein